jgi:formate hydrogenlyase subunit 3/multisubunit Na+/H+ antiporter MnhD subunit
MRIIIPLAAFAIALLLMYLIMDSGFVLDSQFHIPFAVVCILGIIAFSIIGLFDESYLNYAIYAVIIQFGYFLLDISTAFLLGKSIWFAIIQFINFAIAGGLLAIIMTLMYGHVGKDRIRDYAGLYDKNQYLGLALCIACLSLGGMPGFNIFVGEFIIYSGLFTVHPALTMGTIFASLAAFLFYFRICYSLFAGKVNSKIKTGIVTNGIIAALSGLVIILGLVPSILYGILEEVT